MPDDDRPGQLERPDSRASRLGRESIESASTVHGYLCRRGEPLGSRSYTEQYFVLFRGVYDPDEQNVTY